MLENCAHCIRFRLFPQPVKGRVIKFPYCDGYNLMLHFSMKPDADRDPVGFVPVDQEPERRPEPPLVYRAEDIQDHWIVEPSRGTADKRGRKTFAGHSAQHVIAHPPPGCIKI